MAARKRKRERTIALAAIALSVGLASGCSSPARPGAGVRAASAPVRDGGTLVLPTSGVAAYEHELGPDAQYAWFEYGRNDGEVSARYTAPIEATGRWPVPPRPAERHIRFSYWIQR
jgi:hypothetical protein